MGVLSLFGRRSCSCPGSGLTVASRWPCPSLALVVLGGIGEPGSSHHRRSSQLHRTGVAPRGTRACTQSLREWPSAACRAEGPSLPLVFPHGCSFEFRASGRDIQAPSRLHMLSLDSRISPDLKICPLLAFILHKVYIHFLQHL